ncbi:helix-turn-helix domain-containing protein [Streptomyces sp. SP17BM10]|uniref:helix-turn-helix domain-containing protein n=1 Tax=Streptomyces sp. SP17BM10 TaxID=3002530 RepID=UPI002E7852CD|nr:helix-turn-helix domain-containing protein [Streptomyces sp. SP17BM10]MEE1786886.1 helix-turn-helix domain-containing protein [Streptomyces sp. SP17BM10]
MTHGRYADWSAVDEDVLDWHDQITKDVIEAITRTRKDLEMTAQELADETRRLGHEVPRNVIANWESGRRKTITIPELIVVAEALDVAPADLVFSPALGGHVNYLPGKDIGRWSAFSRFTGEHPHSPGTFDLYLLREHARIWQELQREHHDAFQLEFNFDRENWSPGSEEKRTAFIDSVRLRLQPVRARMRETGCEVPDLAPSLKFLNAELPPLKTDFDLEDE